MKKTNLAAWTPDVSIFQIADAINNDISKILLQALSGEQKYRDDDGFVKWGLVEKDIHAAVVTLLTTDNKD